MEEVIPDTRRQKAIPPKFRGKNNFELKLYSWGKYYSLKSYQSGILSGRFIR